jgi:hypothetical protein
MSGTISRWEPFRGLNTLQDHVNRLFEDSFARSCSGQADLASWAPAVDIYEIENELGSRQTYPRCKRKI